MKTITRLEIAEKISEELGLSVAGCEDVISQVFTDLISIVKDEGNIHIKNFGSFELFKKKPRPGRNISKNIEVIIEEKNVVRFSASRNLRKLVNSEI
jgi:integration host factor subunit alpha